METNESLLLEQDQEIWKDVLGYEGIYQISSLGRVKSLSRFIETRKGVFAFVKERVRIPNLTKQGYFRYKLSNKNKEFCFFAHRLVAFAFIKNINNKPQVNHIDGNKKNNKVSNLEWVTDRENSCHKFKNGNCSSRYIGVCYNKHKNRWESSISILRKSIHLGTFKTEEEAYAKRVEFEKNNNIENKYL